jgi:DNA polymerase
VCSSDLIIAVGKIAAQQLLDTDQTMADLRGSTHSFGENNIPLVVIYHPAYLLRSPTQKSKVWSDILLAQDSIN